MVKFNYILGYIRIYFGKSINAAKNSMPLKECCRQTNSITSKCWFNNYLQILLPATTWISNITKYIQHINSTIFLLKINQSAVNQTQANKQTPQKPNESPKPNSQNPANHHTITEPRLPKKKKKKRERNRCSTKYLTELERVLLTSELQIAGDEDEHSAGGARGLAIDGANLMLALLERQTRELGDDVWGSHDFLALKRQHRPVLVQVREPGPIRIEGRVVVLHECLRHSIRIHHHGVGVGFGSAAGFFSTLLYCVFFFPSLFTLRKSNIEIVQSREEREERERDNYFSFSSYKKEK